MDAKVIDQQNHAPFAPRRASQTLLGQLAKALRVSPGRTQMNHLARAPIAGSMLLALGRTDTGRANFALLPARHPGAGQSWEQTQFGFIFNVDIGSGWRMS